MDVGSHVAAFKSASGATRYGVQKYRALGSFCAGAVSYTHLYNLQIFREDGSVCGANEKGIAAVIPPLPPGCLTTVWGQDDRFVSTYFNLFTDPLVYSSYDWAIKDDDGYFTILGRTDDVINVAGHRLGTREIEEAIQNLSLIHI